MSKGSWKRPVAVSHEEYEKNWDRIFAKKKEAPKGRWSERGEDHKLGLLTWVEDDPDYGPPMEKP
jgi:hypothetical protein